MFHFTISTFVLMSNVTHSSHLKLSCWSLVLFRSQLGTRFFAWHSPVGRSLILYNGLETGVFGMLQSTWPWVGRQEIVHNGDKFSDVGLTAYWNWNYSFQIRFQTAKTQTVMSQFGSLKDFWTLLTVSKYWRIALYTIFSLIVIEFTYFRLRLSCFFPSRVNSLSLKEFFIVLRAGNHCGISD